MIILASCTRHADVAPGVPYTLAQRRSAEISDVRYMLSFDIPESLDSAIRAEETVKLKLEERADIVLDFREDAGKMASVCVNGKTLAVEVANEHVTIPRSATVKGENTVEMYFVAGEQSLNRRRELLYTLLVPDRARTLFPCFDQPDLKAVYELTLTFPEHWCAISNSAAVEEVASDGRKTVRFAPTEPLSTYLFSFVAGEFERYTAHRNGREISMYYRETDPAKVAQCPKVTDLVFSSLEFLEEYTGIAYPFSKYDFIVLPSFQYGGMEHTGATLYNDRRIFLGEKPTTDELLGRAQLIAHETAHMWFGDYVTMSWFNDVWTKEVFANWMAAQMVRPIFPEVDHLLGDLKSYYAPAYAEDRTAGSNAIQRPLDNLSNAGLIYCNIIYDKAPVMMEKLAKRMGADAFRRGVQAYLHSHAYSNASWDDLIACLQAEADFDLGEWSRVWVKEKGMPVYTASASGRKLSVSQRDPFGNGNVWQQDLCYTVIGDGGQSAQLSLEFTGTDVVEAEAPFEIERVLPNTDALGYGCFVISEGDFAHIRAHFGEMDSRCRMSLLMSLYENVWRGTLPAEEFASWVSQAMLKEPDAMILSSMLSYAVSAERLSPSGCLETALLKLAADSSRNHESRLLAFRSITGLATSEDVVQQIYAIWDGQRPLKGMTLGESDYTSMAYELMLRYPERYEEIRLKQRSRITNSDRIEVFDFICMAAAPEQESRDAFFESLLDARNRRPESSALSALSLLNHPLRQAESLKYLKPALEALPEIQRTQDIFFPASWCKSLLSSHMSMEATETVQGFIDEHAGFHPLLMTKVLQSTRVLE